MTEWRFRELALLAVTFSLVLFGGFLRFHDLGHKSLWTDELFSADIALFRDFLPPSASDGEVFRRTQIPGINSHDTFLTLKAADQSPPLNEFLMRLSGKVLGFDEYSMRLHSAIAGTLLLIFIAVLAVRERDHVARRALILALFFSAFSPALIEYAQEARAYALGSTICFIAFWFWYVRWRDSGAELGRPPVVVDYVLWLAAAYTHYNALIFVSILAAFDAYAALRRSNWRVIGSMVLLLVLFLPWLWLNYHALIFSAQGGIGWAKQSFFSAFSQSVPLTMKMLGEAWSFLFVFAAWLVVLQRNRGVEDLGGKKRLLVLTLIYVWFLLICYVVGRSGVFHSRHFVFLIPVVYFWAATTISAIRSASVAFLLVVVFSAGIPESIKNLYGAMKEDYRSASSHACSMIDSDVPVVTTWAPNSNFYKFYLRQCAAKGQAAHYSLSTPAEYPGLCDQVGKARRVVFEYPDAHTGVVDGFRAVCGQQFSQKERTRFYGVSAEVWNR